MARSDDKPPVSKRNMVTGIFNGALFHASQAALDPETVLTAFALQLMGGNVIYVGILASVIAAGWHLPEAVVAPFLARKRRMLPYYRLSALGRVLFLFMLYVVVEHLRPASPLVLFGLVTVLLFAHTTAGGVGIIPFFSIVSDTIPTRWRGRFFGARWLLGGLLAFGAGFVVRDVLSDASGFEFPSNYALLFLWSTIVLVVAVGAFCVSEERPRSAQRRRLPMRTELARGPRFYRKDANFRRVTRARALFTILSGLSFPFIVPYALVSSHMTPAMIGIYLALRALSQSLSNLAWSPLSDRAGNLRLLRMSGWLTMAVVFATLAAPLIPMTPLDGPLAVLGDLRVAHFMAIAVLLGIARGGALLGHNNYLLDLTPNRVRPTYLAFYHTILFPLCWVPFFGSLVIGEAGRYTLGFTFAAVLGIGMMADLMRLSEVRPPVPQADDD